MMTIENFESEIDAVIVNRGYDYYSDGAVMSLARSMDGSWKAKVAGTDDYRVRIVMSDNEITDWECSCPFDWGSVCKHIVAVLYKLQAENRSPDSVTHDKGTNSTGRQSETDQISEILENLSHDELKDFVRFYADGNSDFKLEILSEFSGRINVENKSDYKQIVRDAYDSAMDEWGYIEYGKMSVAVKPAESLLNIAEQDLGKERFRRAMKIAQAVLEESAGAIKNCDDSSGYLGGVIDDSMNILFEIAEEDTDPALRKYLFDWSLCEAQEKKYSYFGREDDLLDLAACLIDDEEQEQVFWDVFDKMERALEDKPDGYTREKYATTKLNLLKQRRSKKEVRQFLESNIHFISFRKELVEEAIREKDYAAAIKWLLDGIDYDTKRHHRGTVHEWKEYLLKIAQIEKETETVRKLALELFSTHHSEIEYFRIWKNTFQGAEKERQIEKLIASYQEKDVYGSLTKILIEEKRFRDLLEVVKKSPGIRTIERYEKYLKTQFPGELVKLYARGILSFLERNKGRNHYLEACRILKKMKILGGEETVKQLVTTLKELYPRRRALIDELSRL